MTALFDSLEAIFVWGLPTGRFFLQYFEEVAGRARIEGSLIRGAGADQEANLSTLAYCHDIMYNVSEILRMCFLDWNVNFIVVIIVPKYRAQKLWVKSFR